MSEPAGARTESSGAYTGVSGAYPQGSCAYTGVSGAYTGVSGAYTGVSGAYPQGSGAYTGVSGAYTGVSGAYPEGSCSYPRGSGGSPRGSGGSPRGSGGSPRGSGSYPSGSGSYPSGSGSYPRGSGSYPGGSGSYPRGSGSYPSGSGSYPDGSGARTDGSGALPGGGGILLATINAKWIHPSLALRLLKANLGPLEDRCAILEFALRQPLREKVAPILAARPRILGLSVSIWNHAATLELLRALRKEWASGPRPVVVLGGPEVSYLGDIAGRPHTGSTEGTGYTEEIFSYADYCVRGEGEAAFRELCGKILAERGENGEPLSVLHGTTAHTAETGVNRQVSAQTGQAFSPITFINRDFQTVDVSTLKTAYHLYTDEDVRKKLLYVEASRGCPFGCEFCQSARSLGSGHSFGSGHSNGAERAPATAERAPATAERAPGGAERAPATAERAPDSSERAPATAERAPGGAERAPDGAGRAPDGAGRAPATAREFPLEPFLAEMDDLLRRGARTFKFLDRTFNLNIERARRIMAFFLDRLAECPLSRERPLPKERPLLRERAEPFVVHFEMVPSRFSPALVETLARFPPGALRLEIGIQTLNPEVAARIGRPSNPAQELAALRLLREKTAAIIHADLIAGLPGEDMASFARGFDLLWSALAPAPDGGGNGGNGGSGSGGDSGGGSGDSGNGDSGGGSGGSGGGGNGSKSGGNGGSGNGDSGGGSSGSSGGGSSGDNGGGGGGDSGGGGNGTEAAPPSGGKSANAAVRAEIQLGILKLLPGAPIARRAAAFGMRYNPAPPYELWESAALPARDLDRLKNFARFWELIVNRGLIAIDGSPIFDRFMALSDSLFARFGRSWGIDKNELQKSLNSFFNNPILK